MTDLASECEFVFAICSLAGFESSSQKLSRAVARYQMEPSKIPRSMMKTI